MTDLDVAPSVESDVDSSFSHFICCQIATSDPTEATTTLCGIPCDSAYEGEATEVGCVVCNHMAWSGCCPHTPDRRCVEWNDDYYHDESQG